MVLVMEEMSCDYYPDIDSRANSIDFSRWLQCRGQFTSLLLNNRSLVSTQPGSGVYLRSATLLTE